MALCLSASAQTTEYPWQVEEVAAGVFAFLQPQERRFDDSNTLVVIGPSDVVVVDSQSDRRATGAIIDWIREHTDAPVRTVINTHWHSDHTQNNVLYRSAFGEDVEFMGHTSLGEDIVERAAASVQERVEYFDTELPGARERLERGVFRDGSEMSDEDRGEQRATIIQAEAWLQENRDLQWILPNRPYGLRQRLRRAGQTIELIHFGGHTRGDTVVWLPEAEVVATGDLVDDMPYAGHSYPKGWVAALERIADLGAAAIVPGHGTVFRDQTKLEAIADFLDSLVQQAGAAAERGDDLETTIASIDLSPARAALASDAMSGNFFDQVLPEAIERAWLEARGEIE